MKTKIIISLIALLFIAGDFVGGCEEEEEPKPDYITVNVIADGNILMKDNTTQELSCESILSDATVRVDIIKAGGEQFNYFVSLGEGSCYFKSQTATFKLYKEQPIEVIAYTEYVPTGYTQIRATAYLTWDEVRSSADFGETYKWEAWLRGYWLYN